LLENLLNMKKIFIFLFILTSVCDAQMTNVVYNCPNVQSTSTIFNWNNLSFQQQVINAYGTSSILRYYPCNEATGTTANDVVKGINGTYSGSITLQQPGATAGNYSVLFNADAGYLNLYNSALNTDFPRLGEGSISMWFKKGAAWEWADVSANRYFFYYYIDVNNQLLARKVGANSILFYLRGKTAATTTYVTTTSTYLKNTPDKMFNVVYTWSKSGAKCRIYINGTQYGTGTTYASDTLQGNFASASCYSGITTSGNISQFLLLNKAVTQAEIVNALPKSIVNIVYDGDSRTTGHTQGFYVDAAIPNILFRINNIGVSGHSVQQRIDALSTDLYPLYISGHRNIVVIWAGINDTYHESATAATIYSRLQSYCAAVKAAGWDVVLCSEIDAQGVLAPYSWHTTVWPTLNGLINANHSFANAYANLGANPHLQDATNTTYFNADKVHTLSIGGDTAVANYITPAVKLLLNQ
jgi:hypothetical protein